MRLIQKKLLTVSRSIEGGAFYKLLH